MKKKTTKKNKTKEITIRATWYVDDPVFFDLLYGSCHEAKGAVLQSSNIYSNFLVIVCNGKHLQFTLDYKPIQQ